METYYNVLLYNEINKYLVICIDKFDIYSLIGDSIHSVNHSYVCFIFHF